MTSATSGLVIMTDLNFAQDTGNVDQAIWEPHTSPEPLDTQIVSPLTPCRQEHDHPQHVDLLGTCACGTVRAPTLA